MGQNDVSEVERYALKNVKDHVGIHVCDFITMTSSGKKIVSNDQVKDLGWCGKHRSRQLDCGVQSWISGDEFLGFNIRKRCKM